jgi:hypothetical protein
MVYISSRGTPTYGYTQPDEFRENPALRKREQYALPTEEDNQTTWNDVGDVVGLGVNQLKRSVGTTLGADDYAEEARKDAEYYYNAMTPQMQRNLNATILPQEGTGNDVWDEDISAAGCTRVAVPRVPPRPWARALLAVPWRPSPLPLLARPLSWAAAVGILADRGISGAMTYGEVATSIDDTIRQMDTNTILKNAPTFQSYLDRHKGNEMAAKEEYARGRSRIVASPWRRRQCGPFPAPARPSPAAWPVSVRAPRTRRSVRLAASSSARASKRGLPGYAGQQAPASQGLGEVDWYDVANQSLAGGVLGGTTGGIVGVGAHFLGPQKERAVRSEPADGVDPEKRAALAAASPVEPTAPAPAAGPVPAAPTPPVQAQPEVPPEAAPAEQPVQPTPAPVEPAPVQTAVPTEAEKPLGPKRLEEIVRFEAAGSDITLSDDQIKEVVKGLRGSVRPADIQSGVVASAIDRVAKGLPAKVTEQVKTDEKILAGANNPATGEPVTGTIPEAIADLQAKVDAVARGEITGTVFPSAANVVVPGDVPLVDMGGGERRCPRPRHEDGEGQGQGTRRTEQAGSARRPASSCEGCSRRAQVEPRAEHRRGARRTDHCRAAAGYPCRAARSRACGARRGSGYPGAPSRPRRLWLRPCAPLYRPRRFRLRRRFRPLLPSPSFSPT